VKELLVSWFTWRGRIFDFGKLVVRWRLRRRWWWEHLPSGECDDNGCEGELHLGCWREDEVEWGVGESGSLLEVRIEMSVWDKI
tara:strand:- start:1956 stop:2207 length:252 start_codon:yes stop_codon:yes gene_type:complete